MSDEIRRLSLRETAALYKRFMNALADDPRRNMCGVTCACGPNGEPVACAYAPNHGGNHSWAWIPTLPAKETT